MMTNIIAKAGWTGGQYSVFRMIFAAYLAVHFAHLLPWAGELFSHTGMLADGSLSPLLALFPNILRLDDSPLMVQVLVFSAVFAALAFGIGWHDRLAAIWLWYVLACLYSRNPLIANPALPYVGWMLLAHICIPARPYGALSARGRVNPSGEWVMPAAIFSAASIVLALSYSYSGYTKLLSPSWVSGDTLAYVLQNPLARDWWLRDVFLGLPAIILSLITWFILVIELAYAPLALIPKLRPWLWGSMLIVQFGFLLLLDFPDLTFGMLMFHLLTFDPTWLPQQRSAGSRIYYDGECGLCHKVVRFVLSEDSQRQFYFSPLGSDYFRQQMSPDVRMRLPDSLVLQVANGDFYLRSDAVIHILKQLGGLWLPIGLMLQLLPKRLRDWGYDWVGAHRKQVFAQPLQACPLLPAELQQRFMLDAGREAA